MRTLITEFPFSELDRDEPWHQRGRWPCRWIHGPDLGHPPFVVAYRRQFALERDVVWRVHVSADERYELFLDGRLVGRGSEYGDPANWYYETYDLSLDRGSHTLVAKVWSLGESAPFSQMSVRHGFLFAPEGDGIEPLGTGVATWEYKKIEGFAFVDLRKDFREKTGLFFATGAYLVVDGQAFPWGVEEGRGEGWAPAAAGHPGANRTVANEVPPTQHVMRPAVLPPMMDAEIRAGIVRFVSAAGAEESGAPRPVRAREALEDETADWDLLKGRKAIVIPPHTQRRVLFDLENYYCAYPAITTSGGRGSTIGLAWSESLFEQADFRGTKGNRDVVDDKYFCGLGDVFKPDGGSGRTFRTLWWRAGRYLELTVETADDPLTIECLELRETRYPLEFESRFRCDDARLNKIPPIAFRTLQMCAHEGLYDCPYYEQLMYSGDARLQALTLLMSASDDRLVRKCIDVFGYSRLPSGLTRSRYPSRVRQVLPPFSLCWVGMVYDYALWRGDPEFVRQHMPVVRGVLDYFLSRRHDGGLVERPEGWNFIDWVPAWLEREGEHPGMEDGPSGVINWQLIYILGLAARLEDYLGEPDSRRRWQRAAGELAERARDVFWDEGRGLFANDVRRTCFSEHAQCFAVLSGLSGANERARISQALARDRAMERTTPAYTHYLFETYRELDLMGLFFQRLDPWFELETLGLLTTPEQPEPSRSDCHGWGAHPIYHLFASLLGVRPEGMGFSSVRIDPKICPLQEVEARLVHPKGWIEVEWRREHGALSGWIRLPEGVNGLFHDGKTGQPLTGGVKEVLGAHH